MRTVKFELLRPDEILEEKERCSIVYLPLGPLEWHGPAMPYGTDPIAATEVAIRTAKNIGGIVMPTLYMGTEKKRDKETLDSIGLDINEYIFGMDFPKNSMPSLYSYEDIFAVTVREHLRMLVKQEYKLIVIVNGHGASGQIGQLNRLADEFTGETHSKVICVFGIAPLDENDKDFGHATRSETAIQMAINKDSVDLDLLPKKGEKIKSADYGIVDGATFMGKPNEDKTVIYDPREATAELGEKYIETAVNMVSKIVKETYINLK